MINTQITSPKTGAYDMGVFEILRLLYLRKTGAYDMGVFEILRLFYLRNRLP